MSFKAPSNLGSCDYPGCGITGCRSSVCLSPSWDMFPFCFLPFSCSQVQTSPFTWISCKELVNHCIKYCLESLLLLFSSQSKSSCWIKLVPEQNSSPGWDAALLRIEMLMLRMGLTCPTCRSSRSSSCTRLQGGMPGKRDFSEMKKAPEISLCAEQGVAAGSRRMGQRRRAEGGFCAKIILVSAHRFQRRAEKRAGGASGSFLTFPRCRGGRQPEPVFHSRCACASLPPSQRSLLSLGM